MAFVLADRVKETTTTTGTGAVTLLGASTGFQSFAAVGDANNTYYCIAGQTTSQWEVGIGTYTASGTTLSRDTVLANSAGTQPTALTFLSGTKDVFVTYPSEKSVNYDAADLLTVADSAFTLQDNADPTKQARFELSGITTATTRTYTLPNLTGSLATIGTLTQTFSGTTTFSGATVTVGSSTAASTYGLGTGATLTGTTKTVNIGTAGVSGSTTNINIGSAVSGAATDVDIYGTVQNISGAVVVWAPAPASIGTTATLTNANIQGQIINTTGTSYTVTMPLGTTLETLISWAAVNLGYDFTVINTASGTITMAVNTGVTSLGGLTIATGVSAQFRIRRTAANTFILYRLG